MKKIHLTLLGLVFLMILSYAIINIDELAKIPSITGNAILGTRLLITETQISGCNITFKQGWNLVSFNCLGDPLSQESFFENSSLNYSSIRIYQPSDNEDPWKTYNPYLPNWTVQDNIEITREKGYWMYIDNNSSFFREDSLKVPTLISLGQGWNLIGYPHLNITEINETFGRIIPNFDYVYIYNHTEPDWKQWTWNTSLVSDQDLNKTHPGYGYWIYMLDSDILLVG